jgi:hypothetical protein
MVTVLESYNEAASRSRHYSADEEEAEFIKGVEGDEMKVDEAEATVNTAIKRIKLD